MRYLFLGSCLLFQVGCIRKFLQGTLDASHTPIAEGVGLGIEGITGMPFSAEISAIIIGVIIHFFNREKKGNIL